MKPRNLTIREREGTIKQVNCQCSLDDKEDPKITQSLHVLHTIFDP